MKKNINNITEVLSKAFSNYRFSLYSTVYAPSEVFSSVAFLPVIDHITKSLIDIPPNNHSCSSLCIQEDDDALFGLKATSKFKTLKQAQLYEGYALFTAQKIFGSIPCDVSLDLLFKWAHSPELQKLSPPWLGVTTPQNQNFLATIVSLYPWFPTINGVIEIEPGWDHLVRKMLSRIEVAIGWTGNPQSRATEVIDPPFRNTFNFFHIYIFQNKMRVAFDLNANIASENMIPMVRDIAFEFTEMSQHFCAMCGEQILPEHLAKKDMAVQDGGRSSPRVCDLHTQYPGYLLTTLFHPETNETYLTTPVFSTSSGEKRSPQPLEEKHQNYIVAGVEKTQETSLPDQETPLPEMPPVNGMVIYDTNQIDFLIKRANNDSSDREYKKTRPGLLKECVELGGVRPFAKIENIKELCDGLRYDFPNFSEVINHIETDLILSKVSGRVRVQPILIEGKPGIGKTLFGRELAQRMQTGFEMIHMESTQTGAEITGSAEYWSNAKPGKVFRSLVHGKTANPVFLVDELDKTPHNEYQSPGEAMLALLENNTAKEWEDSAVQGLKLDTTGIIWIITTNDARAISDPIKSRVTHITVSQPTREQSASITKLIYKKTIEDFLGEAYPFDHNLDADIIDFVAVTEPRGISKLFRAAVGKAVRDNRHRILRDDIIIPMAKKSIGFISK